MKISTFIAAMIVVVLVSYGSWRLQRWWHYKFAYQSQVQTEVQTALKPVLERISVLESNVAVLNTRTNK